MPGLLDMFANPEATAQLGAGLLSGNFGAGATGYFQAINAQRQNALKEQMLKAQLGEIAAQTQQRQAAVQKQVLEQQEAQRINGVLQTVGRPQPARPGTGQVNAALPPEFQIGAQPALPGRGIDYQELIRQKVPANLVEALAKSADYGRAKVARTVEGTNAQGQPVTIMYDDFGQKVGEEVRQWKAPVQVDQGNRKTFIDQVNMRPLGSFQTFQSPDSAASNAVTMRGQNMTDARARETLAQNGVNKPTFQEGQWVFPPSATNPQGRAVAVPGFQGKSNMTEDQGKATGWLIQAENAWGNMQKAVQKNSGAAYPGFPDAIAAIPSMGIGGLAGNVMRGTERQQFMQASSSLSESLLRAATGAGVNKDEAAQKIRELTPAFGDDKATVDQKMAAIPLYLESLKVRAGPGAKKAAEVLDGSSKPPVPMKGMVVLGYKFKGGDPGDQNNWEKQ